jgi:AbrB family looped-hinge helix DNA binding protein
MTVPLNHMPRTLVAVNRQGRLTLPADVRRRLGIGEGSQLEVRVQDRSIELRPTAVVPEEDRWAYTSEALASLKRALSDIKAGYVFELSETDLLRGKYPKRAGGAPSSPRKPRKR